VNYLFHHWQITKTRLTSWISDDNSSLASLHSSNSWDFLTAPSLYQFTFIIIYCHFPLQCSRELLQSQILTILPLDATQSAEMLWQVVRPSVCPSVCLVCLSVWRWGIVLYTAHTVWVSAKIVAGIVRLRVICGYCRYVWIIIITLDYSHYVVNN